MFSLEKNYIQEQQILIEYLKQELEAKSKKITSLARGTDQEKEISEDLTGTGQSKIEAEASITQIDELFEDQVEAVVDDSKEAPLELIDQLFDEEAELDSITEDATELQTDLRDRQMDESQSTVTSPYSEVNGDKPRYNQSIQSIIDTYIPKNVLFNLNEMNPEHVFRGKRKFVTLVRMKVDQVNLLSKQLSPESYVKLYNKIFNHIFSLIYQYEGIVNQFAGESLFAVFGLFDNDDQANAVKVIDCIKGLTIRIKAINSYLAEKGLNNVNMGIGVHSGEIIVGSLGKLGGKDLFIFGDEVKICESIEIFSKRYHFKPVFSEKTTALLSDHFQFKQLDVVTIPEVKEELPVFQRIG